jgi:Tol biopolymer transport system component
VSLSSGQRLGRYEILKPLGAGGMGEVYRARDTRLDRDVAIKILPSSVATDPDRLARFEREAKAVAALSHPNVLALHDVGNEAGTAYAVTELLEGETLRDRLSHGILPVRKAVDVAIQIARGLTAAHAKGLVHRDLKPENVFLVADGQVKILDFGLAKAADPDDSVATSTQMALTDPGAVLGTVGYMAPEQVRGQALDARTDLFALGAVLYEMVAGERAFRRETAAETMTAILREDVPDLPPPQAAQAPALDRIIRHCLEKNPAERFQSARDIAFALEALSGTTGTTGTAVRKTRGSAMATLAMVVVAGIAAWAMGYVHLGRMAPVRAGIADLAYQPVTFDEGFVFVARFARDGRTIVYSADWENQTRDVFVTSLDNPGGRALGYKGADLLALAPDGALAILVDSTIPSGSPYGRRGTIARASLTGGAPRKELDRVGFADFGPDGSVAVSRRLIGGAVIEWPQGTVTVPAASATSLYPSPRISPSGDTITYFACDSAGCSVRIGDKTGKTLAESRRYFDWWGVAWAPGGHEVWYAVVADTSGKECSIMAMDLAGRERLLFRVPGAFTLHDVSRDGRILASFDQVASRQEWRESPASPAHDISWKEGGGMIDVSPDGVVLFGETGNSAGPAGSVYLRDVQAAEPLRLSDGFPLAITSDGRTALVSTLVKPFKLSLVPTTGLAQPVEVGEVDSLGGAGWLNDGRLLVSLRRKAADKITVFARPASGGALVQLLPAGFGLTWRPVAPDGKKLMATDESGRLHVCDVPESGQGTCRPLSAAAPEEQVAGWTADSQSIYVYTRYPTPVRIDRIDVAGGRRELHTTLQTANAAVSGVGSVFITPKGAIYYNYLRNRSVLYAISGVK